MRYQTRVIVMKIELPVLVLLTASAQGAPRAASKFVEAENWYQRSNLTRRSGQQNVEVVNTIDTNHAPPGYVNHNSFYAPLLFSVVPSPVPYQTQEVPLHQEATHLLQVQHSPVNLFTYTHPKQPVVFQQAPRPLPLSAIPIVVDPVAYNNRYELDNFEDEVIIKERVLRNLLEGKFKRFKGIWPEAESRHQYSRKRKLYAAAPPRTTRARRPQVGKTSNEEDDEVQAPNLAENLYSPRKDRKDNPLYSFRAERATNGNIVVIIPKK